MVTFSIYLLTFFLIVDCLLLGLLILIQLPKKEAGVGVAFGGGATDALFGAGSGNALSNLTKYTCIAFFVLVFSLSVLNNHARNSSADELQRALSQQSAPPVLSSTTNTTAPARVTAPAAAPAIPLSISSNTVAPTATAVSNAAANAVK